ncbi:Bifunctional hemolysin/adenylate cyclase (plasmid) [Paracoccus marcusii]|uniref:hypothetical protein n=1 Tax=Paracoccus marcusii TaxID=59779 RepID=UPI001C3CA178|nr:hypothetical protein [Paracoccus marcusii]QXI65774.1 Bifunctional hemolysin/adenylate cyclase [Paracoccus marcusii]
MKAEISSGRLVVSGSAASTSYRDVRIENFEASPIVTDNGEIGIQVPVEGAGNVRHLDLSGLSGAGTSVSWYDQNLTRFTGSRQDDHVNIYNDIGVRLALGLGNDYLRAGEGSDTILGGSGDDTVYAGAGDDFVYNELGNDFIDGGDGYDTLIMSGNRADYEIVLDEGMYQVTHLNNGREGTDRFGNVEALQFADQTVELLELPTNLDAEISSGRLVVSGSAASTSYRDVRIENFEASPIVTDNGEIGIQVPVEGAGNVRHLDLSGLSGAGTSVSWYDQNLTRFTGSRQDDHVNIYNDIGVRLALGLGNDYLRAGEGSDTILGGSGDDTVYAGAGDDFVYNELGNDFVDGGDGYDTLIMSGNRADYEIVLDEGMYQVTHLNNGREGTDRFGNVEALRFADQTVELLELPTNLDAEISSGRLVVSGSAASTSYRDVRIENFEASPIVTDNGEIGIQVPVEGAGNVRHLDLSGLSGAGTSVSWYDQNLTRFTGSRQDDHVNIYNDIGVRLALGLGNDYLRAGEGSDTILGGSGDDTVYAGAGDDFVYNELGNDFIDGGDGYDTLIMSGNRADYEIVLDEGMYQVTHLNNGREGTDRFGNVEALQFADQTVGIDDVLL